MTWNKIRHKIKFTITWNKTKIMALFLFVIFGFFVFDWLTKYFIFDVNKANSQILPVVQANWKIIGFRSLAHYNTTFLSFINVRIDNWIMHLIDFFIATLFISAVFFVKRKYFAITLGILVAGVLGNGFDRLLTDGNYVRDIVFTPWWDRGTFNFADIFIFVGAISTALGLLFSQFGKSKN